MSVIINIDTASENAHVSIAKDGEVLQSRSNDSQKDHAGFLQAAIREVMKAAGVDFKETDAVAVTAGPGSYTGLRVGMASAKGLCYALKIPLITIGTLEVLTASALDSFMPEPMEKLLFCPMMDARRVEVFTAIYHNDLTLYLQPCALVLDEFSFEQYLSKGKIIFFGSGSNKWQQLCRHPNAVFKQVEILPKSMSKCTDLLFSQKKFTDLAYSEPFYLKEFQAFI